MGLELIGLDPSKRHLRRRYKRLVELALSANTTPYQSQYNVRGAGLTSSGHIVVGGNHEAGITRAIHCEESLIAQMIAKYPSDKLIALAFHDEPVISAPCGNCRDFLMQYSEGLDIISGKSELGRALVTPFSAFLKEDFEQVPIGSVPKAHVVASRALRQSHGIWLNDNNRPNNYGVAILDKNHGIVATGGLEQNIAYHPTYPLQAALATLVYGGHHKNRFDVGGVVITGEDPKVPYLDRQHLEEFVCKLAAYRKEEVDLPIWMLKTGKNPGAYRTSTNEWLPHAFSARPFNMLDRFKGSIERAC